MSTVVNKQLGTSLKYDLLLKISLGVIGILYCILSYCS